MSGDDSANPFEAYARLMASWFDAMRLAPDRLNQSILPDWSLIRIDETNSTAPATEKAIIARQSYGRQIGRMMDALAVLIDRQTEGDEAFTDFNTLKKEVDAIKDKNVLPRIDALAKDIETLKVRDPEAYQAALKKLRAML